MKPSSTPHSEDAHRVKCPDCPDGQLWDKNGPTSDACLTCGGNAFIWASEPEDAAITDDDAEDGEDTNVEDSYGR